MEYQNKLLFGIVLFLTLQVGLFLSIILFDVNLHPLMGLLIINLVPGTISMAYVLSIKIK